MYCIFDFSLEEEVFKRFEGEAGGELMRACVCMLEVSRHGLLETELLALLGDEKNIKVPEYKEGEEGLVLEEKHKAEAANLNEAPDDNDDLVKQKLAKQVQETYIKDEKEKDKKEKGNKSKFERCSMAYSKWINALSNFLKIKLQNLSDIVL